MPFVECDTCTFTLNVPDVTGKDPFTAYGLGLSAGMQLKDHGRTCGGYLRDPPRGNRGAGQ